MGKAGRDLPGAPEAGKALSKELGYFENNASCMRRAEYRERLFFVGSGVVEPGCRTVIGERLKQSGMRWSVRGANAIIGLRKTHAHYDQPGSQWRVSRVIYSGTAIVVA